MTKKEMFATIATVNADNAEIVEFCKHEIELLENRKTSKKGLTKTQKANEEVKAVILDVLAEAENPMTVSEMLADERLAGYTNQKISALLRLMKEDNKVVKTIEGKKAYFAVAVA